MPHWRALLDPGEFIGPQDFDTPKELTISRLSSEQSSKDEPKKSAMMYFSHNGKELPRKYKVPKSVMYGLSLTLGSDYSAWEGKKITLHKDVCMSFGEKEECVRVQFDDIVETKIIKWMKKRKANPSAYKIK